MTGSSRDSSSPTNRDVRHDDDGSDSPESPTDLPSSSLRAVVSRAREEFRRDHLTDLAARLTYYATLSAVPALIVLVGDPRSARPRHDDPADQPDPGPRPRISAELVKTSSDQAQATDRRRDRRVVGVLVALWSASGYVAAFMRASNVIYDIGEGRPIWKTVPISNT